MEKEIVNQFQKAQDQPKQKPAKTHVKQTKNKHNKKILKAEWEKSITKITVPGKISFKTDGEIKSFSDKHKLREFSTTKPAL